MINIKSSFPTADLMAASNCINAAYSGKESLASRKIMKALLKSPGYDTSYDKLLKNNVFKISIHVNA